jgi:hypothetical protein
MKHIMHFALQKAKPRNATKSLHLAQTGGDLAFKQVSLLRHYMGLIRNLLILKAHNDREISPPTRATREKGGVA